MSRRAAQLVPLNEVFEDRLERLPVVLRILLENVARRDPGRLATCVPALMDIAATFCRRGTGKSAGRLYGPSLLVLSDDMTTDHISPAGQIAAGSFAGQHLIERGDPPADLNVYAARRGNWRAMVRGLFDNRTAANVLIGGRPASRTIHAPTLEEGPLWDVAERYRAEGHSVVLVAGERYGTGSSRDWAAKGVALLGVIARSFERIHRANLVGMGVLPIVIDRETPFSLGPADRIEIDAEQVEPRGPISVTLLPTAVANPCRAALRWKRIGRPPSWFPAA